MAIAEALGIPVTDLLKRKTDYPWRGMLPKENESMLAQLLSAYRARDLCTGFRNSISPLDSYFPIVTKPMWVKNCDTFHLVGTSASDPFQHEDIVQLFVKLVPIYGRPAAKILSVRKDRTGDNPVPPGDFFFREYLVVMRLDKRTLE